MMKSQSMYIFLSRPRRFGKSLLTSTLRYYFEGQRELFEGHYQQMLYVMFELMGGRPEMETHTANGRINLMLSSKTTIYIIELKIDSSAQAALDQINKKEYASRYALEELPIVKIGINFDTTTRTISEWKIER